MDEAFLPLHELLPELLPLTATLVDQNAGIRQVVTGCAVETPIELDLTVLPGGGVEIGAVPPLYHLETSFLPVFHGVRISVTSGGDDA